MLYRQGHLTLVWFESGHGLQEMVIRSDGHRDERRDGLWLTFEVDGIRSEPVFVGSLDMNHKGLLKAAEPWLMEACDE